MSPELALKALEAAPDATVIIDETGAIRFANRQAAAMFGYLNDELVGLSIEALLPERFRSRHADHRQRFFDSVRVRPMGLGLDLYARRRDGTEIAVEICLSPLQGEDRLLVAASIRDVTDRKRAEAELSAARDAANRANQAKSRFLATASHDLRQPLQTLALLNGTLRRASLDPIAEEVLAQQEQAIAAMSRLLNALLDISKLESGAIKPDPSDFIVSEIFEELRREFAGLAHVKGLDLKVEACRDCVHSDRSLVGQILRNLLTNAIKYTRSGWVALRCLHDPPFVRLEVIDTGIGIPADQLAYIYDEFFQVRAPTDSTREGYGLGLSIVKRVAALLDVKLDVASEPGKGSTFAVTLPAARTMEVLSRGTPPVRTQQPAQGSARILLVEDDYAVRNATRLLLKSAGFQIVAVASLAEALKQVTDDPQIDLLITDYHLQDGNTGADVIAAVRATLDRHLEAVLITGDTSSAITELARVRLMHVASKPVDAEKLLSLLRTLTDASRSSSPGR